MKYVANGRIHVSDGKFSRGGKTYTAPVIIEPTLETRALADGSYLLKNGPNVTTRSPLGTGQCGSCAVAQLTLYHLSPASGITVAVSVDVAIDPPPATTDADIVLGPDWRTVTVYRRTREGKGREHWLTERYCLVGKTYDPCESSISVAPPEPRRVKWRMSEP